jgi:hypothetical protein
MSSKKTAPENSEAEITRHITVLSGAAVFFGGVVEGRAFEGTVV